MRRLTSQQMAEVALEALVNARRLYDDAVSLRQGDRLPSALMVAGLAADELGKHVLVTSFYNRDQTDDEWSKFWRRFRNHQEKLGDALLGAWAGDLISEDPPPDAAEFHQERLLATYVDVTPDGTVSADFHKANRPPVWGSYALAAGTWRLGQAWRSHSITPVAPITAAPVLTLFTTNYMGTGCVATPSSVRSMTALSARGMRSQRDIPQLCGGPLRGPTQSACTTTLREDPQQRFPPSVRVGSSPRKSALARRPRSSGREGLTRSCPSSRES